MRRDIEESIREQSGYSGYLATKPVKPEVASSHSWLKVASEPILEDVSSQYQPQVASGKPSKNADNSQLAILATSDTAEFLRIVCGDYGVTRDWLDQFVICPQDVEDIKNGDLTLLCLRAHNEYHRQRQRKWKDFKQSDGHVK